MTRYLAMVLLMGGTAALAQNERYQGYVMNPAAFRHIRAYCVDTHNLPAADARLVENFVAQESRPRGLLAKLPWQQRANCATRSVDARLRLEFPRDSLPPSAGPDEVTAALLVFQPGSPSPIYETPPVAIAASQGTDRDDRFAGKLVGQVMEYSALSSALRMLIHDCREH